MSNVKFFYKRDYSARFLFVVFLFIIVVSFLFFASVRAEESFFESIFSSSFSGAVELVPIASSQLDYEGYNILNMDSDKFLTEEDLALRLDSINEQITNTSTNLTYLQTTYGLRFRLTSITTNLAIKNSINSVEYQGQLPQTRVELEQLAEQINGLQNQIGDLDLTDSNIVSIKQYLDTMDENIYYALWYTGRG